MNKRYWMILFFLATASSGVGRTDWPAESDTLAHQLLNEVQVAKVDILLSFDTKEMERQLWDRYANKEPAKKYGGIEIPGSVQVWLIPCVWESGYVGGPDGKPLPMRLGHIRVWAYYADTAEKAGFMTCK